MGKFVSEDDSHCAENFKQPEDYNIYIGDKKSLGLNYSSYSRNLYSIPLKDTLQADYMTLQAYYTMIDSPSILYHD